jgi:hypothetical protein
MGMAIRNAEKLGLHRDGSVLGLTPVEIENRRHIWWQIQHVDLALAVRIGLTPMTLTAGWDVKMPSNIEDEDVHVTGTIMPKERKGLTGMSYCRFIHWVLDQQRQTFLAKHGRFELSWQANTAISSTTKKHMMTRLEDDINQIFCNIATLLNLLIFFYSYLADFLSFLCR